MADIDRQLGGGVIDLASAALMSQLRKGEGQGAEEGETKDQPRRSIAARKKSKKKHGMNRGRNKPRDKSKKRPRNAK